MMSVISMNHENFDHTISQSKNPVLVDFWASWCGPCTMLSPVVEQLAEEHPELTVAKVNVDEAPELARRFQIAAIPTLLLFRDGQPAGVSVGVKSKQELEAFVK
ncbi:MAG: thioredoxin [Evtepia sp.]|nr:thioredoxin [Evtepia sp.]